MKTFFSFFIALFFLPMLMAQEPFAAVGTTWYYTQQFNSGGPFVISTPCIAIDTIQGKPCSVFSTGGDQKQCVYQDSGKVYAFNAYHNRFYPLYDFTMEKGDTLRVLWSFSDAESPDSLTFTIDSVGITMANGKGVITQYINTIYEQTSILEYSRRIYKDIGHSHSIFPGHALASPAPGIRCKIVPDDEENSYRFTDEDCTMIISSTEELTDLTSIEVYPNPTTSIFRLDIPEEVSVDKIELIDFTGKTIWEKEIPANQNQDCFLPPAAGIYFLAIHADQTVILKKIIKL